MIAIASLVGGIFGKGGGNELQLGADDAGVRRTDGRRRPGARPGSASARRTTRRRRRRSTSRSRTRPAAPSPSAAWRCRTRASVERTADRRAAPPGDRGGDAGLNTVGGRLTRGARRQPGTPRTGSSSRRRTRPTGHPIAVMGPQVGYYVPQILMEEDLHGPGIDARGAAFPGVNLYVQLGHGRDYAWSATTATSDNVDTFAEVLCKDNFHYLYKGKCLAMEKLDQDRELDARTRSTTTPAGSRDADRLPDRARDRLRPRQGRRQEGRLRRTRAAPTSTRPTR